MPSNIYKVLAYNYYRYIYNVNELKNNRKFIGPFMYIVDMEYTYNVILGIKPDTFMREYKKRIAKLDDSHKVLIEMEGQKDIFMKDIVFFSKEISKYLDKLDYDIRKWIVLIECLNNQIKCSDDFVLNIFNYFLSKYPDNPDLLAYISRYYASNLFKLYKKDKRYLFKGLQYGLKAQKNYEKYFWERRMPTYIFAWNGYIYMELGEIDKANKLYNKAIYLNNKYYNRIQPEPYMWKARALTKVGKYNESNKMLLWLKDADELYEEFNDKRDFRFFRRIAENYIWLMDMEKAYLYLRETIKLFVENWWKIEILFNWLIIDIKNFKEFFYRKENNFMKNSFESFIKYNRNKISYKDIYDEYILFFAWLYKENLLWKNINLSSLRDIDRVCYIYLYS